MESCASILDRPHLSAVEPSGIDKAIRSIGSDSFCQSLLQHLDFLCGAEHCVIYASGDDRLKQVSAASLTQPSAADLQSRLYVASDLWRRDPGMEPVRRRDPGDPPMLVRLDIDGLGHSELRERIFRPQRVCDRVLLSAHVDDGADVVISVVRTAERGLFGAEDLRALDSVTNILLVMAARHIGMERKMDLVASALTSLGAIQRCIAMSKAGLARREADVCARILYGMTSPGIALDLQIGEESAMTYRKRAYSRLSIGSQRELLLWYLAQWSQQRGVAALATAH